MNQFLSLPGGWLSDIQLGPQSNSVAMADVKADLSGGELGHNDENVNPNIKEEKSGRTLAKSASQIVLEQSGR